jgi:hypothetical protein
MHLPVAVVVVVIAVEVVIVRFASAYEVRLNG